MILLYKKICLFILIFSFQCIYTLDFNTILKNVKKLKILENRNSELIAEGKDFEHSELSYVWYEKRFKNLFWNIEKNNLYIISPYNKEINIEKTLECKIQHDCNLDYDIFEFIQDNKNNDELMLNISKIVLERINVLEN